MPNGIRIGSREVLLLVLLILIALSLTVGLSMHSKKEYVFLSAKRLDLLDLLVPFSRYLILNPQPSRAATLTVSR